MNATGYDPNNPFSPNATPEARIRFHESMISIHERLRGAWTLVFEPSWVALTPDENERKQRQRQAKRRLRAIDRAIARNRERIDELRAEVQARAE